MKKNLPAYVRIPFFSGLVILALEIAGLTANAQITITSADMPVAGQTYFTASDTNVSSAGSAGANQQWDFSGWSNHGIDTSEFVNPSSLTGFSAFSSSDLGLIENSANIFLDNSSSSLDILGFYGDFGGGPSALPFVPAQKFISFPSNYQTTYSGTTKYEMALPFSQPPIDSVKTISTINYSSEIDAWGSLTTPSNSNSNCLRQKFTEIKTDSSFARISGVWTSTGTNIDTTISYRWWSDTKEYPVAEIKTDGNGNVSSAEYLTTPTPPVQISFTANPMNGCAPLTIDFTNTSTDGVYYQWDFNDGDSYFGFDTSHTFVNAGMYFVSLVAADSFGNPIGYTYAIIKVDGSAGFFEMASDSVCPGDVVNFKGQDGALDYEWNFGDGVTSSGDQWTSHSYSATGSYSVSLTVTTSCGVDTIIQNILVGNNITPETGFNIWPMEICPNQPVNLYSYPVGNNYQWNFGDGNSGSGQFTTHSYPSPGNYTITCIVTNSCGNSSTSTGNVSVVPNAQFPQDIGLYNWPQPACPGTEIYFGAPSDMASYIWNYGDGSPVDTSASNEVTHSFSSIGTYSVSVTITNYCGNDTTLSTSVNINNNVPFNGWFDMNINPSPACPGSTVFFNAWSNDAVSYQWNFGDGGSSNNQSDSHIYPNVGNYNVSLTLTNACGSDTAILVTVNVNNNVIPDPNDYDFGVAADTACSGDSILFYIAPSGSGTYLWNFGDGSSTTTFYTWTENGNSVDIAPHVYANNGVYNVAFTLTNQCGNSFTDSFSVTIGSNVQVDGDLWVNDDNFCQGDTVKFNSVGGAFYVWNFGDGTSGDTTFGTITEIFHAYNAAGDYPVSVNITNSCGNSAAYNDTITVDSCAVAVNELKVSGLQFSVYPNPNNGKFKLQLTIDNMQEKNNISYKIYNILGEMVYTLSGIRNSSIEVDLSEQPGGIYFIQLNSGGKIYHSKFVKE